jgi:hypothetical protein
MMISELSDAAAGLVADLPDNADDLSSEQLESMAELLEEIADRLGLSEARIDAMIALTDQRGYQGAGHRLDYLTNDEQATFEDGESHALDAKLAYETIERWGHRSGWHERLRRRATERAYPNSSSSSGPTDAVRVSARRREHAKPRQPAARRKR